MRKALERLGEPDKHIGLAYDRWAPIDPETGKIPDAGRAGWLARLTDRTMPPHYAHAYDRWLDALRGDGSVAVIGTTVSRLLVGHGNASPTEVGITVHPTWGVPMIPGSALKGLLAHYVDAVYGPEANGHHPLDGRVPPDELDRTPYQGVTWSGSQILHGPGEVYRRLFGAPSAKSDGSVRSGEASGLFQPRVGAEGAAMGEIGAAMGSVIFQDALYVAGSDNGKPFAPDVITVHQKEYYNSGGTGHAPNDYDAPNPISFLTVRPGTQFLLALTGDKAWTDFAMQHLCEALADWGVGSKTTAGYGLFEKNWKPVLDGRPPPSSLVSDFEEWLSSLDKNQYGEQARMTLVRERWVPRFQTASDVDRDRAEQLLRKNIKAKKRPEELQALIDELKKA